MTYPIFGTDGSARSYDTERGNAATANNFNVEWILDYDSFDNERQWGHTDDYPVEWNQWLSPEDDSNYDSDELGLDLYPYVFGFRHRRKL